MIIQLTMKEGAINQILALLVSTRYYAKSAKVFVPIYVISNIWQNTGWNSIIYLAALTNIDQELYTAAKIGANRFRQLIHITLPGLLPTVIIMLILQLVRCLT